MGNFRSNLPLGTTDVKVLLGNSSHLDEVANSREKESTPDRFGRDRKTLWGMECDFQRFLVNSGYQDMGDYAAGLELTARNQMFHKDGELYRAPAALALPYMLTGDWAQEKDLFVAMGDQALRQQLLSASGPKMMGLSSPSTESEPGHVEWVLDSLSIPSVSDLSSVRIGASSYKRRVIVGSFYPNQNTGGGIFTFDPTAEKTLHDGRNFISPTVFWDGSSETVSDFLSGAGESSPGGRGLWVRAESSRGHIYSSAFGEEIQRAIDSVNTGDSVYTGGVITLPAGRIRSTPLSLEGNEPEKIVGVELKGAGKQATTLDFTGQVGSGVSLVRPIFAKISDLSIRGSDQNGIDVLSSLPGDTSNFAWNHLVVSDVRLSFNQGHGLRAERGFMGRFEGVYATHNQLAGFYFTGPVHTSLIYNGCYADKNTQSGYDLSRLTYSTLSSCAADNNGHHGYRLSGCSAVVMSGCGSESNQRSGIYLRASSPETVNRNVIVDGFFAYNNNKSGAGFSNAVHVESVGGFENSVHVRGCRSYDPAFPTADLSVNGLGAYVTDEDNSFPNGVAALNGGYIHHVHKTVLIHGKQVLAATPIALLRSTLGSSTSYGGEITIRASNHEWSSARTGNIAVYKLLVSKDSSGVSMIEMAKVGRISGDGVSAPAFSFSVDGQNRLIATPVGAANGVFYFEILTSDFVRVIGL